MALTKWGFIYTLGDKGDPDENTDFIGSEACRLITVAVERPEQAFQARRKMRVSLCGIHVHA
jgi:hypothetical protein